MNFDDQRYLPFMMAIEKFKQEEHFKKFVPENSTKEKKLKNYQKKNV